ncbi:hypothetical protein [Microbacterium marinilacus]|uniref:Uncharacterized protein n=1 Tax=Microbacterium marinilacus TaxID=415209 RepID=A0ABP7BI54_9MICO|nr:hypothetical protein [Microbacterium marinilacus]MBY0687684.1 hypothetical protein [Microbacterium marinilacus]
MDVSVSGRMGGPETGARYLASIVRLRAMLKAALGEVAVAGVEVTDIELWVGGTVTDHAPGGFSSDVRYFARQQRLLLAVLVPAACARSVDDDLVDRETARWIVRGFEDARMPRSAQRLDLADVSVALRSLVAD